MKNETGFTLLELVMAMAVLAILSVVALPAMSRFLQDQRTTAKVNELIGAAGYARSEAVARGRSVALVAASGDWNVGVEVRLDVDGNGVFTDAGDALLRSINPAADMTLTATPDLDELIYLPSGLMDDTAWGGGSFQINMVPDDCRGDNDRNITVSLTGIVSVAKLSC